MTFEIVDFAAYADRVKQLRVKKEETDKLVLEGRIVTHQWNSVAVELLEMAEWFVEHYRFLR